MDQFTKMKSRYYVPAHQIESQPIEPEYKHFINVGISVFLAHLLQLFGIIVVDLVDKNS